MVERITYYNEENGYSVVKVMPDQKLPGKTSRQGLVTVVGSMPELGVGESAEFNGEWVEDPRYGTQMRVQVVTPIAPTSEQGITRYLSSGIVKGIGPVTAGRIVDHFGVETLDVLNRDPQRLHDVPGLKTSLVDKLAEAWEENYAVRQTMIFLQGYGVSSRMSNRIYGVYGAETITKVKENPYSLADDVFGVGFLKADQIARNMGLAFDAPERIRAGLSYTLDRLAQDGHTYAPTELLIDTAKDLLQVDDESLITVSINEQVARNKLIMDYVERDAVDHQAIYLPHYHRAETGVAKYLKTMNNFSSKITEASKDVKWQGYLDALAASNDVELTEQQQGAVKAALTSKVNVLTGGPGTGKTTTLQMVINALDDGDYRYALASPTGRAAKRLAEATGREAYTIHRLFGFKLGLGFYFDEASPLEIDMLIIDEASMIDLLLFHSVLRGLKPETHLMLVGDVDQLPSVGAGNVLRDVIASGVAYVTRLENIFRQSEDSHIIVNAHRVNDGEMPFTNNTSNDFFFFGENDPERAADLVVDIVRNRIPKKFPGINPITDVQVIAPMYRTPVGINMLNEKLQEALNSDHRKVEKQTIGKLLRKDDKIMQTRNNYEKDVFNGDIGYIRQIDDDKNRFEVIMDDRVVNYDYTEIEDVIHAYCISIHRSQGSEYPIVVIPLMTQHYMMLQRNLLYTAITRARQAVILVGNRQAIRIAVTNNKVAERFSGLLQRLRSGLKS